jgi:major membrane immunogen (membrane-anchored lipoprotein)
VRIEGEAMIDKPTHNSTGPLAATTVTVVLALGGCSPKIETVTTHHLVRVESGMTIPEVDHEIGAPGEAVEFNALPKAFQQTVSGNDGAYRKWTKTDDKSITTVFAEIKDGKIVGSTYADMRDDSRK